MAHNYFFIDTKEQFNDDEGTIALAITTKNKERIQAIFSVRAVEEDNATSREIPWLKFLSYRDKDHVTLDEFDALRMAFLLDLYQRISKTQLELAANNSLATNTGTTFSAVIPLANIDMLDESDYLIQVLFTLVGKDAPQNHDRFFARFDRMLNDVSRLVDAPPSLYPDAWEAAGISDLFIQRFIREMWREANPTQLNVALDHLFVLDKYPTVKQRMKAIANSTSRDHQLYMDLWLEVVEILPNLDTFDDNALRLNVMAGLLLIADPIYLANHLSSQILSRVKMNDPNKTAEIQWFPVVNRLWGSTVIQSLPLISTTFIKMVIQCESFVCAMCLAMTSREWPALVVQNEEFPGYRSWSTVEIPLTPWRSIEIMEIVERVKYYIYLSNWLNWAEYHWLLFFGNVERFWPGSGGKSSEYLNTDTKRDRATWTCQSLAQKLLEDKERAYTFPVNGIIVEIKFGGIPQVLGLNTLIMAETEPGQVIFVAKDKSNRAAIGRWSVYEPTLLHGFLVPFSEITEDDELLLAACITSLYYDLLSARKEALTVKSISAGGEPWLEVTGEEPPEKGPVPIYGKRDLRARIDRVEYNSKTIKDGETMKSRVRSGVIGHRRWISPQFKISDERRAMADAHHVFTPPGYTFVLPHERGGDPDQPAVQRLTQVIGLHRLMMLEIEQPEDVAA